MVEHIGVSSYGCKHVRIQQPTWLTGLELYLRHSRWVCLSPYHDQAGPDIVDEQRGSVSSDTLEALQLSLWSHPHAR